MTTTDEIFQKKLKEISNAQLAEKARSALGKLCSTGGKSFIMTIPPRLDDTDMILSEIISRFELLSIASVIGKDDWISVDERLPDESDSDENGKVLIYRQMNDSQKSLSKSVFDWWMVKNCERDSFWQSLPAPPKDLTPKTDTTDGE